MPMLMFKTEQKIIIRQCDDERFKNKRATVIKVNQDDSALVKVAGVRELDAQVVVWPEDCEPYV